MGSSDSKQWGTAVRVRVPASVANNGPGFDIHSIALESPHIEVELMNAPPNTHIIHVTGTYAEQVTTDPSLHAAAKALDAVHQQFEKPEGYVLRLKVNIPPRKGLGLSGAEAVGAVLCARKLFNLGLSMQAVVRLAAKAEPSHHMDNVAASALGGFNIIPQPAEKESAEIATMIPPRDLGVAVLVPNVQKSSTEAAREILPSVVSRQQYVESMSHVSRISAAFAMGDVKTILATLPLDAVIESARADAGLYGKGIDAYFLTEEKKVLFKKFHVAETISGAGPSRALWFSISEDRKMRRKNGVGVIESAIDFVSSRLKSLGYEVQLSFLTRPSAKGAKIIRSP